MATARPTARPLPAVETFDQIQADCRLARDEFRRRRLLDPLRDYNGVYPEAEAAAAFVIDALDRLLLPPGALERAVDGELLSAVVADKLRFQALRALAAPPISEDDLDTLLDASVNKTAVKRNQALADEIGRLMYAALDPRRFPWVLEQRPPTPDEFRMAQVATAVLISMNTVYTRRRSDERDQLEGCLDQLLMEKGYISRPPPPGGIADHSLLPEPGEFIRHCKLGKHNADLVVRLFDGRLLAIECKASNSTVNGEKRLNKEVVADAGDWYLQFGRGNLVAAALRGVFKPAKVLEAQTQDVFLFWWHRIDALGAFLDAVGRPADRG